METNARRGKMGNWSDNPINQGMPKMASKPESKTSKEGSFHYRFRRERGPAHTLIPGPCLQNCGAAHSEATQSLALC